MSDWTEVKNWEACKAKGEGKEVEFYEPIDKIWLNQNDPLWKEWEFSPKYKYRIKTPDPARLLGKVIWSKDGKYAQILSMYNENKYYVAEGFYRGQSGWLTIDQIEKEFDVK